MKEITMRDLIHLCSRFQVKFSVSSSNDGIFYYNFGKVSWAKLPLEQFTYEDFYEVSLHLAATYPEKVLTNG
jgi:hypothetical protein